MHGLAAQVGHHPEPRPGPPDTFFGPERSRSLGLPSPLHSLPNAAEGSGGTKAERSLSGAEPSPREHVDGNMNSMGSALRAHLQVPPTHACGTGVAGYCAPYSF